MIIIKSHYDTVIFDLDGTLLNTLDDLTDSVNAALRLYALPLRTTDEIRRFVGNGVERLMTLCVPEGTDDATCRGCLSVFKDHYTRNMRNKTAPYEGIKELLYALKEKNLKLAVISNKFDAAVKELCGDYFEGLLDAAIGVSQDVLKKPAPDIVRKALQETGSVPERTVYVGDSEVDCATARNAGLFYRRVLGVSRQGGAGAKRRATHYR
jgi:phosphoglycolate phosphatase